MRHVPSSGVAMKMIKNLFLVLCVFSLCSKVVHNTNRHFYSAAVTTR